MKRATRYSALLAAACMIWAVASLASQDGPIKTAKPTPPRSSSSLGFVPDQVLVKFSGQVTASQATAVVQTYSSNIVAVGYNEKFHVLSVPTGSTVEQMVETLKADPAVEYAEPNYICRDTFVPNDPLYSYQWHFPGINCPQAWDISTGSGVIVAILDGGIAYENYPVPAYELSTVAAGVTDYVQAPDLAGTSFAAGYDFINGDSHPNDNRGHGTHVAGTVAQTTNNAYGVAGMAFDCTLMPVKVIDYLGSGSTTALVNGLYWATDQGADVINMSLSYDPGVNPGSTLANAIQYAYNNGVVLVASSGNAGVGTISYPAKYSEVIAAGATRYDDQLSYYSQFGPEQEVVAPGGDLTVDQNGDTYGDGVLQQTFELSDPGPPVVLADPTDFGYWFLHGTSMAAPHVTALAAMLIASGTTGVENVRSVIRDTALDLGTPGFDNTYGWGRIDAQAALEYATADTTAPVVTVTSPNGGETWYTGDSNDITWTATDENGVTSISLYYSINGGDSYQLIASGEINDSVYPWTVPNTPTDSALVKVVAYDPSSNPGEDVSDAFFAIADSTAPLVAVTSPNGGETWYVDTSHDITWTASDDNGVDSVSIYYSINGGGDYTLLSSQEPNDGTYPWTLPDTPSDSALVKVVAYDPSANAGQDMSDGFFVIARDTTGPVVMVTSPNGGEIWDAGAIHDITWTAYDPDFATTDDFADGNDDGWTHWCYLPTCDYTVTSGIYSVSGSPGPAVSTLDASNGWSDYIFESDVRIDSGTERALVFRMSDSETFYKVLMRPARLTLRRNTFLSDTTLVTVPGLSFSTGVWYRVSIAAQGADIKVSVDGVPLVDVTDPDPLLSGAVGLGAESSHTALFDNVLVAPPGTVSSVDLVYSTDGGATFPDTIATGEPDDSVYEWTVPSTPTTNAIVKAVAYDSFDNAGEDVSDAAFTIFVPDTTDPAVTVTAPNGGETWYIGDSEDITWTATDANGVDSVSIYYSINAGGHYNLLASQEANDGTFPWTIPDSATVDALVKVVAYDPSLNEGEDVSDAVFTITDPPDTTDPAVTVTAPNGGETWYIGDSEDITWTATDANGVDSVSIFYSVNAGGHYNLLASQEANDGTFPWTIPDSATVSALVKVVAYDPSLNEGEDVSDAVFTITDPPDTTDPAVTVTAPNGAETWYIGDSEDITWTASDANGVDSVSIYYSVNAGGDYTLIASQEANDGTFPWTIPDTPTVDALVKVVAYDPSLNEGEDVSDAVFTITDPPDITDPAVTVTAPNGGETWYIGDSEDITWTATDANGVDSVSIYYSVNAGGDYILIASQEANDGTFPWTIPDTPTVDALVKVVAYDPSLNEGEDVSDAVFTITDPPDTTDPVVTVLTPNEADSMEVYSSYDITWTATDANGVDSVSIFHSINGGGDWALIASGEPNDGISPWTIPWTPTDSAMVRIIAFDPSLNQGQDESDSLCVIHMPTVDVPGGRKHLGETVLLWQNRPNPFSPSTNISFYLPEDGPVSLEVFDAKGRRVSVLMDGRNCKAGVTTVSFNGTDADGARLSSGVYFYMLKAAGTVRTKKMVVAH